MKILATSDIHQMASKWKELVKASKKEKPEVIAISGDLFPKDEGILMQTKWMDHLKKYARQIKNEGIELILTLGNDDNQLLISEMDQGDKDGLWHYIENKVVKVQGQEFIGMPYVPDYPFGYKYWCHPDSKKNSRICVYRICEPLLITDDNKFKEIPNFPQWFISSFSIEEALADLTAQVEDMAKSIWLIHAPPSKVSLDICANGQEVGSDAVLEFIESEQPMLTIHGHIHEAPEYNGRKWFHQENHTLCVQGGQMGFDLHYSIIEIEDGEIKSKKHSIYE